MDFSFMCPVIEATQQYGLWMGLMAICIAGVTAYFNKGNAIVVSMGFIVLGVLILKNLTTIAGWFGLTLSCTGL